MQELKHINNTQRNFKKCVREEVNSKEKYLTSEFYREMFVVENNLRMLKDIVKKKSTKFKI